MKKYVKIALLVIVALIFLGTFVFLYQHIYITDYQ